ncbi:hypothetical protein M501DRAFT_1029446 [Patellaria atrata CBS 101060]|uniref:Actin-like ATPase domain-containing protein n=1 Tax=Patellaria atrata CBS 101060 TaxID=1346257 RepID=A0A9P4SF15_9PEZI|nr:hypothetical protein M501DRAFT_1029446 [Patellaria atrata CBS 101060]
MENQRPDMIVGVDFGMTCTGVAYANLSIGSSTVRWIQKWPGRGQANENKVPTVLVYPRGSKAPSSWGFLSETVHEQTGHDKEYREWFKTFIDPGRLRQAQIDRPTEAPNSSIEVERWCEDYLRRLYQHIEFKLGPELQSTTWQNARIEFITSVPTTWSPPIVENFRQMLERAGFGELYNHKLSVGLTEAEAAAVHTSTEASGIFRERDILLVCDAGGGTTDLSVLRVTNAQSNSISLQQLDVVFGDTIGSAAIDFDFERFVRARLEEANRVMPIGISAEGAAWEMMKSKEFQNTKCEFGGPSDTPLFSITVPHLSTNYLNRTMGIDNGEMRFTREDLQRLFDKQVQKMFRLIDSQLHNLRTKMPLEQVSHLVLSGGLGNSAYVQNQLRQRYGIGGNMQSSGRTMQVRIAPDPQLAVCKGIVVDRLRKFHVGHAVIGWRCARASYGTICKVPYDKNNPDHANVPTQKDSMTGKLYVANAIAWFIRKGDPVSSDTPIIHEFTRKVAPSDPRKGFPTSIVCTQIDPRYLPSYVDGNTHVICELQADLSSIDEGQFEAKNRHFWSAGPKYFKVNYQVRVIIGPADIRFELWFNGQRLNKDQPIHVEWSPMPMAGPQMQIPPAVNQPQNPQQLMPQQQQQLMPQQQQQGYPYPPQTDFKIPGLTPAYQLQPVHQLPMMPPTSPMPQIARLSGHPQPPDVKRVRSPPPPQQTFRYSSPSPPESMGRYPPPPMPQVPQQALSPVPGMAASWGIS